MSNAWAIHQVPSSKKARLFYIQAEFKRWRNELTQESRNTAAPAKKVITTGNRDIVGGDIAVESSDGAAKGHPQSCPTAGAKRVRPPRAEAAPLKRQLEAARAAPQVGAKNKVSQVSSLLSHSPNKNLCVMSRKGGSAVQVFLPSLSHCRDWQTWRPLRVTHDPQLTMVPVF